METVSPKVGGFSATRLHRIDEAILAISAGLRNDWQAVTSLGILGDQW